MNKEEKSKSLIYGCIGAIVGLILGFIAIFISKVPFAFGIPFTIIAIIIGFFGFYYYWKLSLWQRLLTGGN